MNLCTLPRASGSTDGEGRGRTGWEPTGAVYHRRRAVTYEGAGGRAGDGKGQGLAACRIFHIPRPPFRKALWSLAVADEREGRYGTQDSALCIP